MVSYSLSGEGGPTPTANPDVFPSALIDFKVTGDTAILTVPPNRIFYVLFCMDVTKNISGAGTPHTYRIKDGSGTDIIPAFISTSDGVRKLTPRYSADVIALPAGESVIFEVTIASTFLTHDGKAFIHGLEVEL